MKATGIVRRIDDLGRVVIPKEIRRTMRIREGDPLEIFTGAGGEVVFKKYSPIGELGSIAEVCAESVIRCSSLPVIICDRDHCIAAAGLAKKEVLERPMTASLEEVMESRKEAFFGEDREDTALEGSELKIAFAVPIIAAGDLCGCVCLLKSDNEKNVNESNANLCRVTALFLAKQLEE